jgi:hypothetical protein
MIDVTARHIYDHAQPDAINSWLRTLASIRALAVSQLAHRPPA